MLRDWRRIFGDTKPVGYEHTIHLYVDGPIGNIIWAKKVRA
jgi:hypothetical protein